MGKRSASNRQAVVLNQQKPKIGKDEQLRNGKVIEFYQTLENIYKSDQHIGKTLANNRGFFYGGCSFSVSETGKL